MTNDKDGAALLREAAEELSARAFDHYRARNGRMCSIEGDDGEKCWIIPYDAMEDLRAALAMPIEAPSTSGLGEAMKRAEHPLPWVIYSEADVGLPPTIFSGHAGQSGFFPVDFNLAGNQNLVIAALKSHGQAFDAALLDRAELAWQRFFYPAADNFTAPLGNKLPSVDLEVADCLRLVLGAAGRHVVTPKFDVPAIQNVARDSQLKTVAEKLAAFTGAPYEDWRHFTVEAGDILHRIDSLATNAA
ncbi:hypothetical protein OSJ57_26225, partial [Sphingomonas sp. HH69]